MKFKVPFSVLVNAVVEVEADTLAEAMEDVSYLEFPYQTVPVQIGLQQVIGTYNSESISVLVSEAKRLNPAQKYLVHVKKEMYASLEIKANSPEEAEELALKQIDDGEVPEEDFESFDDPEVDKVELIPTSN